MQLVPIARFGKPFGLQGGCIVSLLGEALFKLELPCTIYVQRPAIDTLALMLTDLQTRPGKRDCVCFFETITSIEDAQALTTAMLSIEHDRLPAIEKDHYYTVDLIGCVVHLENQLEPFGTIADIIKYPSVDVLEIFMTSGKRVQVPFLNELTVSVDTAARSMVLKSDALEHLID